MREESGIEYVQITEFRCMLVAEEEGLIDEVEKCQRKLSSLTIRMSIFSSNSTKNNRGSRPDAHYPVFFINICKICKICTTLIYFIALYSYLNDNFA
jgi:hypothetical protein